jgi:hypothetical protein
MSAMAIFAELRHHCQRGKREGRFARGRRTADFGDAATWDTATEHRIDGLILRVRAAGTRRAKHSSTCKRLVVEAPIFAYRAALLSSL